MFNFGGVLQRAMLINPVKAVQWLAFNQPAKLQATNRRLSRPAPRASEGLAPGGVATEHQRLGQTLLDMDRRKNDSIAILAHELRNPLASICNAAHVLGRLELTDPKALWAQKIIEEQSSHLARMVDDLLDVSRIVRNKITFKKEAIELAALVSRVVESAGPVAERKRHQFSVRLPVQPVQLEGDPVRLSQVLSNLIDNAMKYTPDGGQIELAARMAGQEIEISVRDNGVGVTLELLPHVFELFQQGERTIDRSQGGLGIGLTMVQRLVGMHGGRVKAHSEGPGLGSTFTIWLPARVISAQPTASEARDKHHSITAMRVLVVDDDHDVVGSTAEVLEMDGHNVCVVDTGQAVLEMIPFFRPQVVLLDIGLKGMGGFETAQRLRALPEGRDLCLVCVTGYGDEKTRARAMASGCDHFLVKPVTYKNLSALLASIAGDQVLINGVA